MPHPIRSRRNANLARRKAAAEKQKPKVGEAAWWGVQAAAIMRRYPVPPKYRYSHDERRPEQPACYGPTPLPPGTEYLGPGRPHKGRPAVRRKS